VGGAASELLLAAPVRAQRPVLTPAARPVLTRAEPLELTQRRCSLVSARGQCIGVIGVGARGRVCNAGVEVASTI